jgi:hypothetical protein
MLNSTTLEVAIGMALVYLTLSLFCTAINEAIAGILGSRAKNLEKGIRSLFTEGKVTITRDIASGGAAPGSTDAQPATGSAAAAAVTKTVGLVDAIYQHGLVQSLYKSGAGIGDTIARDLKNLPSYIPSRTFSSALFDILFPKLLVSAAAATDPSTLQATQTAVLQHMAGGLDKISDGPAKEAIATLVKQADGDIDKTRKAFELWYNDGMDRAAGWYKRKTQLVLFFIGLILAVALNVDSIRVAEALWNTPAVRSYAVAAADAFVKSQQGFNSGTVVDPSGYMTTLSKLNLPLGWATPDLPWNALKGDNSLSTAVRRYGFPLIGWFLTAIAMTLGAPFWFDLLNQFMVVRSTIKPEEKSGEEASKDPHS